MQLLLYVIVFVLCAVHLLRIAIFYIASDLRGIGHFRNHFKLKRPTYTVKPLLSIVIPAHNNQKTIQTAIESALNNSYPNLEVIVADFGSTDQTRRIINKIILANRQARLQLVRAKTSTKTSTELNRITNKHTRGSLVMFLDAHNALASDAAANAVEHFASDRRLSALISNTSLSGELSKLRQITQKTEKLVGHKIKRSLSLLNIEYYVNGLNVTFRKSHLKRVGYFSETANDNERIIQTFDKLCAYPCRVDYGNNVYAICSVAPDVKDYIARRFSFKYGRTEANYKNPLTFLPTYQQQKPWLKWLRLPYTVYGDILLTIEPIFALFFVINLALLFAPLIVFAAVLALTFYVSFLLMLSNQSDLKFRQKLYVLLFAPFCWPLFYIITMLEYRTLILHLHSNYEPAKPGVYETA